MLIIDIAIVAVAKRADRLGNVLTIEASFCQRSSTIEIGQDPAETQKVSSQLEIEVIFKVLERMVGADLKESSDQIFP